MAHPPIHVNVKGLERLERRLNELPEHIRDAAIRAVAEETEAVADDMRSFAPVGEGELRDSIEAEHDGLGGRARATARHASFVEFGTSKTPAQPYADPAADISRKRFPERLSDEVRREFKR